MRKKGHLQWERADWIVAAALLGFFGYLFLAFPVMRAGDTYQYEHQFVTREPAYSLLIQILRFITPHYAKVLVFLQNAVTAAAVFLFWRFIRLAYAPHWSVSFLVLGALLAPYLMTPLFAQSGLIMTNAILTEGFTIPLFLLFVMFLLKAVWQEEDQRQNKAASFLLALFLSLMRGQMMVLLFVWAAVFALEALPKKKYAGILAAAGLLAVAFIGRSYTVKLYNYLEKGYFVSTVSGKAMMLANVLYVSDKEYGEEIADIGLRELFYEVYDAMEENGATYRYAGSGIINRALHSESVHEDINFEYFTIANDAYLDRTRGIDASDFMLLRITTDEVADSLMRALLPKALPRFLKNYAALAVVGFIRTVAVVHPVLNIYAAIMYLAAVAICIVRLRQERESRAAKFMLITLLLICGTVFGTSIMIQCLSRYMVYNFAIFYISGLLLLLECYEYAKRRRTYGISGIEI